MMVKTFSKLGLYISNDKDLKGLNRSKLSQKKKKNTTFRLPVNVESELVRKYQIILVNSSRVLVRK